MSITSEIVERKKRLRRLGEVQIGASVGCAIIAAASSGGSATMVAGASLAGIFAICGTLVALKAHSTAPDEALMAMRDKAAHAEAKLAEAEDELDARACASREVLVQMASDLPRDAIEPSEIQRAISYLADPDSREGSRFLPWPRDAAEIATGGKAPR